MIQNGNELDFGQSAAGLPSVAPAIIQFFQPVTVGIIENRQVEGYTQTIISRYIETQGARVETPNQLVITKSGERLWNCTDIYFLRDIILKADDIFRWNKMQYRVMVTEDWPDYGFNRYHVVQDYTKIYVPQPDVI
jgi:hypothetical protein